MISAHDFQLPGGPNSDKFAPVLSGPLAELNQDRIGDLLWHSAAHVEPRSRMARPCVPLATAQRRLRLPPLLRLLAGDWLTMSPECFPMSRSFLRSFFS